MTGFKKPGFFKKPSSLGFFKKNLGFFKKIRAF